MDKTGEKPGSKAAPWLLSDQEEKTMEYIRVTKDNIEEEHICCAISNNRDVQVASKKAWLRDRFEEGLVFLKSVGTGKVLY